MTLDFCKFKRTGTDEAGIIRSVNSGYTAVSCATVGTKYVIKSIRKNTLYRGGCASVEDLNLYVATTNDIALWTLEINPTTLTTINYQDISSSYVQESTSGSVVSVDGTVLASGYLAQGTILPSGMLSKNYLSYLSNDIDGEPNEICLTLTPVTSNINAFGSITFKEY